MNKLFRISTVPVSLNILLKGQLKYLARFYNITAVSGGGKYLEEISSREGVRTKAIEFQRQISPFQDLKSLWKLFQFFRQEKPVIIHSITPKAGLLSMAAGWLAGVPVRMHTFTGLVFPSRTGFMHWLLKNMDRLTCAFATKIIPEGEGVKRDLIRYKVTSKPLMVIGHGNVNGIDPEYFSPAGVEGSRVEEIRKKWELTPDDFVFVFVGRLVKDKGINELVAAFTDMHQKHTHTRLLLVGNFEPELDPVSPATHQLIDSHPCILYAGFQEDVRPYLAVSHALVFPSYREGFPNVPKQAGAMGLPSIVTDINGCNEIITDGLNGLVIPPKDASAVHHAMERLVSDTGLYNHLKSNARESIVSRYDQQTLWKLIKEEYDDQLKKAGLL